MPAVAASPCCSFSGFPREVGSTAVPQAPKQPASSSSGSTSRIAQRSLRSKLNKKHDLLQQQMGEGGRLQRPAAAPASQPPLHVNGVLSHRELRPSSVLAQQSVQQGPATTQQQVYSSPPSSNGAAAGWGAAPGAAARAVPAAEPWLPSPPPSQQPSSSSNGRAAAAASTPRRGRPPATPAEPLSSQDWDEAGAEGEPSDEQIEEMFRNAPPPDVHVVDSLAAAQAAAAQLMTLGGPDSQVVFACDTEVMDIDVTCVRGCCRFAFACLFYAAAGSVGCGSAAAAVQAGWRGLLLLKPSQPGLPAALRHPRMLSPLLTPLPCLSATTPTTPCSSHSPCCHGRVICFSVYAGPGVHFGEAPPAPGAPRRSMLWVDTWLDGDEARQREAAAIAEAFRPFWESEQHKKVGWGWCWGGVERGPCEGAVVMQGSMLLPRPRAAAAAGCNLCSRSSAGPALPSPNPGVAQLLV